MTIGDDSLPQPNPQLVGSIYNLTIEDESLSQPYSQLGDSVHHPTVEDTSLYQPDSQASSSETNSGNDPPTSSLATKRLLLNDFLRSCDADTVGPYKRGWEVASKRSRAKQSKVFSGSWP